MHHLVQLRNYLANGTILFHHKTDNFLHIVDDLTQALINEGHLEESNRQNFKKTLLIPHLHQYEKEFQNQLDIGKKQDSVCSGKKEEIDREIAEPESEVKFDDGNFNDIYMIYD